MCGLFMIGGCPPKTALYGKVPPFNLSLFWLPEKLRDQCSKNTPPSIVPRQWIVRQASTQD